MKRSEALKRLSEVYCEYAYDDEIIEKFDSFEEYILHVVENELNMLPPSQSGMFRNEDCYWEEV